jgi:hypothetical protein
MRTLRVKVGSAAVVGRCEVDVDVTTFATVAAASLVRCHHANLDETHDHLRLDDLTQTRRDQDDVPVTDAFGHAWVGSRAQLHAH